MDVKEIYRYNTDSSKYIDIDITEVLKGLNNYTFNKIRLGEDIYFDNGIIIKETSYQKPFIIDVEDKALLIDRAFQAQNKEIVNKILNDICVRKRCKHMTISNKELITNDVINSLIYNEYINKLTLGRYDNYKLNRENYNKFKKSNIEYVNTGNVTKELEDNFDPLIRYNINKILIDGETIEDLKTLGILNIEDDLDSYKYLKYISKDKILKITFYDDKQMDTFFNIIKKNNINNKIIINYHDKNKLNSYVFKRNLNKNVFVIAGSFNEDLINIDEYKKNEQYLYELIEEGLNKNLSPLERYLYAYNIVKRYREYTMPEDDLKEGQNLYSVINGTTIVCSGYVRLLMDLCDKLHIKSEYQHVELDESYDNVNNNDEDYIDKNNTSSYYGSHAILKVKIDDPKYNIKGIYYSDPTMDVAFEKDLYHHALMSAKDLENQDRYYKYDFKEDLNNVISLKDYYKKLNRSIDEIEKKELYYGDDALFDILEYQLNEIKLFDESYLDELVTKYNKILDKDSLKNCNIISSVNSKNDTFKEFIEDIGKFFINNYNNIYDLKNFVKAASNANEVLGRNSDVNKIVIDNMLTREMFFPKRYKTNKDGKKIVDLNSKNIYEELKRSR